MADLARSARPDVRVGANLPEFSVSELSSAIKRTLEGTYGYVRLRGEISGFRGAQPSGHCYFALKDDKAKIEAVIWRTTVQALKFKPAEGLEVIATGRVTTYPGSSKYQLVIDALEPAGIGALMALLEERKKKLAAEGLFETAKKRKLPYLPRVIGIVTSPTGRGHPRHAGGLCRALSGARRAVAGARPGRDLRRRGGRGHPRVQCPAGRRTGAAARRADRRPRRRQPGGPVGLQRRDRGAGRGGERHPAHLGRRPRDRLDPDRPRRRRARSHAHQGGRMGGAQAFRAGRADGQARPAPRHGRAARARGHAGAPARGRARPPAPLGDLLALPRQRFDAVDRRLGRALLANTRAHGMHLARCASRLQPRLLEDRLGADTRPARGSGPTRRRLAGTRASRPAAPGSSASPAGSARSRSSSASPGAANASPIWQGARDSRCTGRSAPIAAISMAAPSCFPRSAIRAFCSGATRWCATARAARCARGEIAAGQRLDIELADGRIGAQVLGSERAGARQSHARRALRCGRRRVPPAGDRAPCSDGEHRRTTALAHAECDHCVDCSGLCLRCWVRPGRVAGAAQEGSRTRE